MDSGPINYTTSGISLCLLLFNVNAAFSFQTSIFELSRTKSARMNSPLYANDKEMAMSPFVRLRPRSIRGERRCIELQTSVTTLTRETRDGRTENVQLHAQIHFGTREYFDYYNTEIKTDSVHYELLVDEYLMQGKTLRYADLLTASPADQQMAKQYGLTCQLDVIDYSKSDWIHADYCRGEFRQSVIGSTSTENIKEPLWALASSSTTWPGAEALDAVFRPPARLAKSSVTDHTLISISSIFIRILFWMLVPAPELSVLLLDWSKSKPLGRISPIALPFFELLLSGQLLSARQLIFGQMLVSGQREAEQNFQLIKCRNDRAMNVLMTTLEGENIDKTATKTTALLYGAAHCPDLYQRLCAQGFVAEKTTWRTAWTVFVPSFGRTNGMISPNALAIGLVIMPLYFLFGGLDWILTCQQLFEDLLSSQNNLDASATELLYLIRHVALYLTFAKFVVNDVPSVKLFDEYKKK